jgi:hypothetical protein
VVSLQFIEILPWEVRSLLSNVCIGYFQGQAVKLREENRDLTIIDPATWEEIPLWPVTIIP